MNLLILTLISSFKNISIEISKPAVILFHFYKVKLKMKLLSKQMKFRSRVRKLQPNDDQTSTMFGRTFLCLNNKFHSYFKLPNDNY